MTRIPGGRQYNHENHLYQRYKVEKRDTEKDGPDDPNAIYFVLRIDAGGKDEGHIKACQAAALEFARRTNNQEMADDLRRIIAEQVGIMAVKSIASEIAGITKKEK